MHAGYLFFETETEFIMQMETDSIKLILAHCRFSTGLHEKQ